MIIVQKPIIAIQKPIILFYQEPNFFFIKKPIIIIQKQINVIQNSTICYPESQCHYEVAQYWSWSNYRNWVITADLPKVPILEIYSYFSGFWIIEVFCHH